MGLLSNILLFPVTGPFSIVQLIGERIAEQTDMEQLDETLVEEELMRLSLRYDMGEISDDDFTEQETFLLERLEDIREYKESIEDTGMDAGD